MLIPFIIDTPLKTEILLKKRYQWILFDADDTLFHFNAFEGLRLLFKSFDVDFTAEDYHQYLTLNQSLWSQYQQGQVTVDQVKHERFQIWSDRLQLTPSDLNQAYMDKMADICTPLEGALPLLESIKDQFKLGIITNGFTQLQETRLQRMGLTDHFHVLVISEQVGFAKPHQAIFDYALSKMGNPSPDSVLMVGDNPETDILGGLKAGLDTCWLNVDKKPLPTYVQPKYEIASLMELSGLLF